MSSPRQHNDLWFRDGNFVLQAEDVLFNVHASLLERQSELFGGLIGCGPPGAKLEGSIEHPFVLHGVSASALANLFSLQYDICTIDAAGFSTEEYIEILRTADRLSFHNVHASVSSHLLHRLNAAERLDVGLGRCGVDEWAHASFQELVHDPSLEMPTRSAVSPFWTEIYRARWTVSRARRTHVDSVLRDFELSKPHLRLCRLHTLDAAGCADTCATERELRAGFDALYARCEACSECGTIHRAFRELLPREETADNLIRAAWQRASAAVP